ncbi:MAG: D-3-phosphoglycerate dehydrogenase / 2-oxoglutarate reductase, partial [Verrucomicrobiota bacterium]|nr:D-3-phosphoglycerate dehydrogenase / 2-oxoglutarate reductase [Verrucomicrobiota bacterium]
MKILVADKISPKGVAFLRAQKGFEVVEAYGSSPAKVLELVKDVHAIAVRSETKITAEVFAAAPLLKVVGRAGVGVDNVDVDAATERGVIVMNTPSGNTIATAELTFTHILCGARPVPQAAASMRDGKWDRKSFSGIELFKKTLGVIGLGRIGAEVAKRAQAFGMTVVAYDPYLSPNRAKAMQIEAVSLDDLLKQADYITVHMPLTEQTQYMIDEAALAKCKKGVRLFNCARGGIIKEAALVAALKSGHVAAAGLDVFEEEPLAADHELRKFPNVSLTPHLGASTAEAQDAVGVEVAEQIADVLAGGVIRNAVNMPSLDAATLKLIGPYLELGGKLGTLVQQLATDRVEKLRITYFGKIVELDANPVTRAVQRGFLSRISSESLNFINAPVVLERLGVQAEVVKSNAETDYTELMLVDAVTASGAVFSAAGTLLGKGNSPRIVALNGREVEAEPKGAL